MFWLITATLLSFGFGQLWKVSQRRGLNAPAVISTNYLTVAACLLAYFSWSDTLAFSGPVLLVGGSTGLSFIISLLVMTHALKRANVGVVLTSFRLSILIPIVFGVLVWDENASALQFLGIILALVSLALMTRNSAGNPSTGSLLLIVIVFALQGIAHCCMRWIHYADLDPMRMHVLCITALIGGGLGAVFVAIRGSTFSTSELKMGLGIGLFNLVALTTSLTALSLYQGILFFPINGSAVVILDNLFAQYVWREPISRTGLIGVILGVLSMVLIFQ